MVDVESLLTLLVALTFAAGAVLYVSDVNLQKVDRGNMNMGGNT